MLKMIPFKKSLIKLIFVSLILPLFLTSCATLKNSGLIKNPVIKSVALESFSLEKGEVVLAINMFNPNSFSIPITGLNFDLSLNSKPLGKINSDKNFELQANKLANISLPIKVDTTKIMRTLASLLFQKTVSYEVTGNIKTPLLTIPYTKKNKILVKDLLKSR